MADPDLIAALQRLDRALSELLEVRAELAAHLGPDLGRAPAPAADGPYTARTLADLAAEGVRSMHTPTDLADGSLIDTTAAAARFGCPSDQLRRWARETAGTEQAIGARHGGRWLFSPARIRARLNGGG
jgi:hypothetical protein